MRLKGISTLEQHIEKIVLGIVVVVLLGVVSLQFLYEPNRVEAGGKTIAPEQVFSQLEQEVNKLRADVDDPNPPLPDIDTPNLIGQLETALAARRSSEQEQSVAFGIAPAIGGDESIGQIVDGPIMAMTIPEPASPTAYAQWITVDPYAIEDNKDLEAILPAEQPYDMAGVSIATVVDGETTLQLLREGDSGHRPIPATWWRSGGVAMIEVVAERQEMGADGQWSQSQPVTKYPGSFDLLESVGLGSQLTPIELRELVQAAEDTEEEIARPAYIPQIAGPEWEDPVKSIERDKQYANMSDVDLLRAKRKSLKDSIRRLEDQLVNKPDDTRQTRRDPRPSQGGAPGIIGPSSSGNRNPGRSDADRERLKEQRRVDNLNRQIETKSKQIEDIEQQLADLGFPVSDEDTDELDNEPEPEEPAIGGFLGNAEYKVWTHDLDVVPGAVYRYRMRVKVNNPIYGKDRSLDKEIGDDLSLAEKPFVFSPWSSWSEPVAVGRETYLFLSNANESGRQGGGLNAITSGSARVAAEVYHMYYGHYRRGSITLEPGDTAIADVRVPEHMYVFDTELVPKDVAHGLLGIDETNRFGQRRNPRRNPLTNAPDQRQPGIVDVFIDPFDPQGGGKTGARPGSRDDRGQQQAALDPDELPEGVTEAPTRIPVRVDAVLLDVVRLPIGEGNAAKPLFYAYFEMEGGVVTHRRPDLDRASQSYELVRASYLLGQPTVEGEDE